MRPDISYRNFSKADRRGRLARNPKYTKVVINRLHLLHTHTNITHSSKKLSDSRSL